MNPWPDPGLPPTPAPPPTPEAPPPSDAELPPDVAWLFRRSLAEGRIHPLMPLLLRYRREHGA